MSSSRHSGEADATQVERLWAGGFGDERLERAHAGIGGDALFQNIAAAVPVAAGACPNLREIGHASEAGINVDPTRPECIAEAVPTVFGNPDAPALMGRNARQAILDGYNWTTACLELRAVCIAATGQLLS